jgi:hypothetical protein
MAAPHVAGGCGAPAPAAPGLERQPDQVRARHDRQLRRGERTAGAADPRGRRDDLAASRRPAAAVRAPTSLSFGYLRRGQARTLSVALADAGGGAGAWSVSVQKSVSPPRDLRLGAGRRHRSRKVTLRASVARSAADSDASGYLVLTRGTDVRRVPYWLHVTAQKPRPGARAPAPRARDVPRQHTARPRARLDLQVPEQPERDRHPQQPARPGAGFPLRLRRPAANAGAVVVSHAPAST